MRNATFSWAIQTERLHLVSVQPSLTHDLSPLINPSELYHRPNGRPAKGRRFGKEFKLSRPFGTINNFILIKRSKMQR